MSVGSIGYEPHVGGRYLRAKLIQDVTLAGWFGTDVYDSVAPAGKTRYILLTPVNAEDLYSVGNIRVWNNQLWQVEAWSRTNDTAVVAMYADRIDAVLHDTSGVMTGTTYGDGTIWSVQRERALALPPEVDGDVIWRRAGGEYRLTVRAA